MKDYTLPQSYSMYIMTTGTFQPVVVSAKESRFWFAQKKSTLNPKAKVYKPSNNK